MAKVPPVELAPVSSGPVRLPPRLLSPPPWARGGGGGGSCGAAAGCCSCGDAAATDAAMAMSREALGDRTLLLLLGDICTSRWYSGSSAWGGGGGGSGAQGVSTWGCWNDCRDDTPAPSINGVAAGLARPTTTIHWGECRTRRWNKRRVDKGSDATMHNHIASPAAPRALE